MKNFCFKKYILLSGLFLACVLSCTKVFAQAIDFNHYQSIECSGEIPKVIIKNIEKRILDEEKKEISKKDNWRDKKNKEKFIVESSYSISELLVSGAVLFNDTMSQYVTDVARELLKYDPETFAKLHFFVVKSQYVNAFSTNEGIILINAGLLAQLQTEAQLAFVLAHEIAHFKKKHVLNLYIEDKSNRDRYTYNNDQAQDNILKKENYSKEFETEADEVGLEILKQSDYSLASLNGVFDILQHSYLPINEIPFDPAFFNSDHLKIPSSYFLKKVNDIQTHDDASGTHPNISTRRDNILSKAAFASNSGKKEFTYSQAQFEHVRDIARFELTIIYISDRQYEQAIYNSYVLLKKYPNSEFLHASIGNALYFLAKYANVGILPDITTSYANIEGESQQVHYLIQFLEKEDLNLLACEYLWRQYFSFPQRTDIKKKADEILNELIRLYYPNPGDFSDTEKPLVMDNGISPFVNSGDNYNTTRSNTNEESIPKERLESKYVFVDLFKQPEFRDAIWNARVHKDENVTVSKKYSSQSLAEYNPKRVKNLHLQKIVMVDPSYYKINNVFNDNKFDPVKSEEARKMYSSSIKDIAKQAGLDMVLLDSKFLNAKQVGVFNEIARLNAFIDELYIHRNLDSMLSTDYQLTQLLLQKHNTKYLAWNSIFAITEADAMADPYTFSIYSYYMFPLFPYFIYDALTPDYFTFSNMLVADIEKGKIIYNNSYKISAKDTPDRLKSNLYYNFIQLRGKDNKKK